MTILAPADLSMSPRIAPNDSQCSLSAVNRPFLHVTKDSHCLIFLVSQASLLLTSKGMYARRVYLNIGCTLLHVIDDVSCPTVHSLMVLATFST